jgi:O-antigen ligase
MEFVGIGLAIIIALVWATVLIRWVGLFGGVLILMVAGVCFGQPFFKYELGPLPVTIDRVIWGGLVFVYLSLLWLGKIKHKRLGRADWVFLFFLVTISLSTIMHDWASLAARPISSLLFWYLLPASLYWIVRDLCPTEKQLVWFRITFIVLACYLALTGLAEVHGQWWAVFPRYIATAEGFFFGRARGPFLNPMACGFFMSVGLFFVVQSFFLAHRYARLGLGAIICLLLLGIYYTYTRSVWLGAGAGLFISVGIYLPSRVRLPVLGTVMILVLGLGVLGWEHFIAFKRDKGLSAAETAKSVAFRPVLARVAWNMFTDRPILGHGFGQYERVHKDYLHDTSTDMVLEKARNFSQHSTFLALLTETGLIGMGCYVIALVLWTEESWRLFRQSGTDVSAGRTGILFMAMMASYLTNAMLHDMSTTMMTNSFLFLLAGLVVGAKNKPQETQPTV